MLQPLDDEIWIAEHDFRMGAVDFGGRMTVLRLPDASLLLYSAIPIDDALAAALAELGPVRHVVAPNSFHYLFLTAAAERYPDAKTYAPRALTAKRPELKIDVVLEADSPWAGVELLIVDGAPKMDEVVLFHAASRTLVVCDLVFHKHEARGWFSPLFFRLLGVWQRVKQSPLWRFALTKDRAAAERSLEPMWTWDFERVVLSHGRLIEGPDAKGQLAEGLRWMCPGHARRALPAPA